MDENTKRRKKSDNPYKVHNKSLVVGYSKDLKNNHQEKMKINIGKIDI